MVALRFNASQVQPNAALEAIPSGNYPVIITKSEEKPTKSGQGRYIEFEMTIQGGQFHGRKVFDRLNIHNQNQQAVDIAYSTLSAICHVTGRLDIQATEQLHGVPFTAVVVKKERDDQPGSGNMTNEVKGYKDINGNDPGFAGNAGAQTGAAPNWAQNGQPAQNQPPQTQQFQQPQTQQAPQQWQQPAQQQAPQTQQPQVQQGQPPANGQQPPPWVQNAPAA